VRIEAQADGTHAARGGHIGDQPVMLGDRLECETPEQFQLVGRSHDMLNIAGKRTSLAHLNHQLLAIAGVHDGAFFMPDDPAHSGVVRLVAFVVAPALDNAQITTELRRRIDEAFIPRRIMRLDALPRTATGKLPREALAALLTPQPATSGAVAVLHERITIAPDHPAFAGHFPQRPIVPGVLLLDAVARLAERELGGESAQWTLASAKFLRPVGPGATLDIQLRASGTHWRFEIHADGQLVANGAYGRPATMYEASA